MIIFKNALLGHSTYFRDSSFNKKVVWGNFAQIFFFYNDIKLYILPLQATCGQPQEFNSEQNEQINSTLQNNRQMA